jgi:hypothetical protein
LAATVVSVPPRLLRRVLGFCGSTSRMSRCMSAYVACFRSFGSNGVVPVSNSYSSTPSE